jgi:hypothetical protein
VAVTGLIVVVPFAGLIAAIWLLWGRGVGWADLGLAVLWASGVRWPTPARLKQRRRARAIPAAQVLAGGGVPRRPKNGPQAFWPQ